MAEGKDNLNKNQALFDSVKAPLLQHFLQPSLSYYRTVD
jgi:hypothetical protein